MLSRVADALYWMSRYLERAEHIARVVNVNLNVTLDRAPSDASPKWGRLLTSLPEPPPAALRTPAESGDVIFDLANHESIQACVGAARENARQVREEISSEMWEELNRLYLFLGRVPNAENWGGGAHGFLTATVRGTKQSSTNPPSICATAVRLGKSRGGRATIRRRNLTGRTRSAASANSTAQAYGKSIGGPPPRRAVFLHATTIECRSGK